MNIQPLVCVIVPLYNKEQWVKRAIDSILIQSYGNLEILVVNDGSTDNSVEVVRKIEDKRIRIIEKPNGGVSSARNRGMDEAKGEYIAFLDADDMWMPEHIAYLIEGFRRYPEAAIVSNSLEDRLNSKREDSSTEATRDVMFDNEDYLLALSEDRFPIHIGSTMYQKSMLDRHGIRFYEEMRLGEDVNFMIRMSRLGVCIVSNYTGMVYYHDDEGSAMHRKSKNVMLTPPYFKGLEKEQWNDREVFYLRRFLRREYRKKAYQNRGLILRKEELIIRINGIKLGSYMTIIYLLIRYAPNFLFTFVKSLRGGSNV